MRKAELHTLGHITGKLQQLVLRVVHNHRKVVRIFKEWCTTTFELGAVPIYLSLVTSLHHKVLDHFAV